MSDLHQSSPQNSYDEPQIYVTYEAATADLRNELIRKEKHLRFQYQLISTAFNLIAIAQIIIGATITALGPSGGEHILSITILGAFNTSIAGLLALLKGRGLPERLRRNMIEISKVSEFIREREILLRYGNSHISHDEISTLLQEVFQEYNVAQQIIERNQTDTYSDERMPQNSVAYDDTMNGSPSEPVVDGKKSGKARQMDEEMGTVNSS
ncbi:uncharacterized protein N7469_009414 [Penicillium citrinum]|uniref:SMODS and SLOG-associating 2TM effector domain-containing protein n=1 Tax=Penicillium citrinum TaxID=5077 RepID=A0A9W9THZ3_PENCI|nr:uncharacterized protein N7469_009414 [Penicillium citrinum]KAJ5223174.1 hypothetical protein N7469_009414 [Penicillium citrinum]